MKNRFKFRCWDKENKSMFENISPRDYNDPWCILMQCTGLVDINDKLIYERDIVRRFRNGVAKIGYVNWETNPEARWEFSFVADSFSVRSSIECGDKWEKLGNIYENPALLNKEKL